jgi:hypothetical protein
MSEPDDTKPVAPVLDAAVATPEAPSVFGIPIASFVRGGTSTGANDKMVAEQRADDERRRNVLDREREIASVPIEQGGGRMYSHNMGTPQQHPVIKLTLVNPKGEIQFDKAKPIELLCDIISENEADPNDLAFIYMCPHCWNKGVPAGRCQYKVRQSNRKWSLDSKGHGDLVVFDGQVYRSAGTIAESERITCPGCHWQFRIDQNRVFEDKA